MMSRWIISLILLFVSLPPVAATGETSQTWLIVVNQRSDIDELSTKQVMSLFLGRSQFLPGGSRVKTFDFPIDSPIRAGFYQSLTGKDIADIDAYWARMRYSGRASPPLALADSDAIMQKVSESDSGLGYLPAHYASLLADNGLKTVLTMREP